ncbi:hypothetical protein [Tannerella forsythia]|uniref:hypothetical protein n=1 Tax=Tannerella forsythia TaxID=28112 RepID=UPI0028E99854|nr:hypothetical protein [Tannerella forsythia]
MKAIERLYTYLKHKGIKPTNFERNIGLSSGYLSTQKKRNADMGESVLIKINDNCRDLNLEWLLTGVDPMIKEQEKGGVYQSISGNNNMQSGHGSKNDQNVGISTDIIKEIEDLKNQVSNKDKIIEALMKQNEKLINKLTE